MPEQRDPLQQKCAPMQDNTLQHVLSHRIATEFPRLGGPRIRQLCAQMILEVIETHVRSRETNTVVPRRAAVHDLGTGLTHKRIICRKRYAEGKSPPEIAYTLHCSTSLIRQYLAIDDEVHPERSVEAGRWTGAPVPSDAPASLSIFWPQSDKPPGLGRSPKPGYRTELPPTGRTYVNILGDGLPIPVAGAHPTIPKAYRP